jgi:hypothetical protein
LEQSFENDQVRVIYHRETGLDGKVSRLEVSSRAIGPTVDLYEGNNASQNMVCSLPVGQTQVYRFPDHAECDNDEARSLVLHNVSAGTVVILYDSSDGNLDDDWLAIRVKQDILTTSINTFQRSYSDANVDVIYAGDNDLDGKVSRLEVTSGDRLQGVATFYEGNWGLQNKVCDLQISSREIRFVGHGSCDNDEAQSVVLSMVPAGTILRIFDDADCETGDDYITIRVTRDVFRLTVGTFERSFENADAVSTYRRRNGLDGKVSCVQIET